MGRHSLHDQRKKGNVPDDILRDLIYRSHQLILTSLSKKVQKEIMEEQ